VATGVLASPRRRRRLVWGATFLLGVGALVFAMVNWSNTAKREETPLRDEPAQVAPVPVKAPFAKAKREGVLETAARFVDTAVVRRRVADSWELTDPSLRSGYTRASWATEDIPVQPYPVDGAKWRVDYSWRDVVGLEVALYPKKGTNVPAAVFDMELHAYGKGKSRRWLVSSWTPAAYRGIPDAPLGAKPAAPVELKSPLDRRWLLVPFSVFLLALLIPTALGVRGWWRGRLAERRYRSNLY